MSATAQTEKTIFLEAAEIAAANDRAAFLDLACAGHPQLRAAVDALLHSHQQSHGLLDATANPLAQHLGTMIGPYKLLQQIGEGGMGTVYMAEQTEPVQRRVALKIIKPGMDSRQVIARFAAEKQALALMDHVNIARVLDAGTTSGEPGGVSPGRPYFVMELVHGVPITKYCDDNHLTPRQRLELFVPVCQAIQHAHQKGIIHRDIKPTNVMITLYDGKPVPKVIDFGVAKAMDQKLTQQTLFTQYGTMVGTLEYMSPEQAAMSALGVDTRSDIYSLGVLVYELLTGSTPLSRQQMKEAAYGEILRLIKEEEPQKPSTRLSASGEALASISALRQTEPAKLSKLMRGELDWIVMKTLEKDRNRRYETANGFAADLQRYLADEPVQACPPSAEYRFRKFARRNRLAITTASLVFASLVLGTAVSTWQAVRATAAGELAQTRLLAETAAKNATREQLQLTEQAEDKANHRLFEARLAQANAGHLSRRVGQRFESLAAVSEATRLARNLNLSPERFLELRSAAIACLALPDLRMAKRWPGLPTGSYSICFDDTLENYARVNAQKGAVSVRRVTDDVEVASLPGIGGETWGFFSPSGEYLAVVTAGKDTKIWKLGVPSPRLVAELKAEDSNGFNFSSNSGQCAAGHLDGSISLYSVAPWKERRRLPGEGPGTNACLVFDPEDKQLAVARDNGVKVLDLDTEKITSLQHPARIRHLAWHPGGKSLAAVGSFNEIYLWDVPAPAKPRLILEGHTNNVVGVDFNHVGDLVASVDFDNMLWLWDANTGQQLFRAPGGVANPQFSLDDRLLVGETRDNQLGVWEVAAGREYRTLCRTSTSRAAQAQNVTIHPEGRLLAVGMFGGAGLWDLNSGRELAFLELPGYNCVLFEPAGTLLTTGSAGLLRWPVRSEAGVLQLGPPQTLSVPGISCRLSCSSDGRVIASAQFQGAMVLHAEQPDQPVWLGPHDDVRQVAVSRDGQWVVTGSHSVVGVKIWEAKGGKLVKELNVDPSVIAFTPDGKWLMTTGGGGRLWEVGSWREGPANSITGTFALSPDGKILAVQDMDRQVRLVDPATGRNYARLQGPHQDLVKDITFSPDGAQLIACTLSSRIVHVWDLRAIRTQLAGLGLDWDLPAYPPVEPRPFPPLQVEIDVGNLAATIQAREFRRHGTRCIQSGQWSAAVAAFTQALEATPESAVGQNELAWLLATCPDATFRDASRALDLASQAVKTAPGDGMYMNTLGVAHYRAGQWQAAIDALQESEKLSGGRYTGFNAFFLSMSHRQLSQQEEAKKWLDQAVAWTEKNRPQDEELKRFHTEAAELMADISAPRRAESASPPID